MSEEELPNELNKLEISLTLPNVPLLDNNLPVTLNPFFNQIKNAPHGKDDSQSNKEIFGPRCSCRVRRNSESVLEDSRSSLSTTGIERTIINHTQFKHKNNATGSGRRKVLIREPILKGVFVKSFTQKYSRICRILALEKHSLGDENSKTQRQRCPTLEALNLDDTVTSIHKAKGKQKSAMKCNSILDFRSLIDEYQSLSVTNSTNSSRVNNNLGLKVNNTKSFNTMQSADNRSRIRSELKMSKKNSSSSNNSSSTSCSQQARINTSSASAPTTSSSATESSAPCDVTIDELASYFETFVHIPKKMSSMAEMMYI